VKLLLATHALLWFLADDPRLSASARTTIEDPANPRLLSPVSLQEIPGARQMVPQSSASTTARSLRAVRSWVTGPDGLTQATLLTQTRAPSGERLPSPCRIPSRPDLPGAKLSTLQSGSSPLRMARPPLETANSQ